MAALDVDSSQSEFLQQDGSRSGDQVPFVRSFSLSGPLSGWLEREFKRMVLL